MDESAYARGVLKLFPKEVREKKETQLELNLAEVMDSLADSLTEQAFKTRDLNTRSGLGMTWLSIHVPFCTLTAGRLVRPLLFLVSV
jgi:hypothetical protein